MGGRGLRRDRVARLGRDADLQRIDPHRLGDVLELGVAEVADGEVEPRPDLPVGILRKADGAGGGNALQARRDVDAVAHQVAVALLDDVADMDADAELDSTIRRHAGIAFEHCVLHLDGAAHRIDHAAELDEGPVPGALDHSTMMHGDRGIDQVAAQCPQPRQGAILVRTGEPAVADDVSRQDCRKLSGLAHAVLPSSPAL